MQLLAPLVAAAREGWRTGRRRRWIVDRITRDLHRNGAWWSISPVPPRGRNAPDEPYADDSVRGITVCGPRRGVLVATYVLGTVRADGSVTL